MIRIDDYISNIYIEYIITIEHYEEMTGNKCYFDKGNDIYRHGLFFDGKKFYHINKLGNRIFLKQKIRDIKLNKILKKS